GPGNSFPGLFQPQASRGPRISSGRPARFYSRVEMAVAGGRNGMSRRGLFRRAAGGAN
ncbi:hypothetical protein HMPREF9946_05263, partial [Acetobacteraceae bacterium AT-5844]